MAADSSSTSGFLSLVRVAACLLAGIAVGGEAIAQQPASSPPGSSQQQSHEAGPPRRIPRQQALTTAALDGTVREQVADSDPKCADGAGQYHADDGRRSFPGAAFASGRLRIACGGGGLRGVGDCLA